MGFYFIVFKYYSMFYYFEIYDVGFVYCSVFYVYGVVLRIDLNYYNISNVYINGLDGVGI